MLEKQENLQTDCNCHKGGRAKVLYQVLKPENCPREVFISVSDAHQYTNIYKITLNEQGKGTLLLEALKGMQYLLVTDENGGKVNKEISCYIDHMLVDKDEIHINYKDDRKDAYHELKFVEGIKEKNTLEIIKIEKDHHQYLTEISENKTFPFVLKNKNEEKQYELNKDNHFSVLIHDVSGKEYVLNDIERNGYTRSLLHNSKECQTITCDDNTNSLQYIHTKDKASFMIHKLIRVGNDLRKPDKKARFKVNVTSLNFNEVIELNDENDFAYEFFDLPEGTYQVKEICFDDYQVSYMVNREIELEYANVVVKSGEDVSVTILNTGKKEEVVLTLVKWIDGKDDLELPYKDDVYVVEVNFCEQKREIELSCTNDWCQSIQVPKDTEICVCETKGECLLVIDDCVLDKNCFSVSEDTYVHLINEKKDEETCCMMIQVNCPEKENYRIQIRNECDRCCVVLNEENDFCVNVTGLIPGIYHVYEVNGCSSFEINGNFYKEKGIVDVCENCHSEVIVLSKENRNRKGSIEISKTVVMDGKECLPLEDECFEIGIIFEGCRETIKLQESNNWKVCLEVRDGVYTIEELGAYHNVDYMIDGCITNCGEVVVDKDFHEVVIRNHVTCFNCITLTLWEFKEEHLCPPTKEHLIEFCGEQGKSILFDSFHYHSLDFELMDGLYDVKAKGFFDIYVNQHKVNNPIKICKDTCIDLVFHEEFEQSTLQIFAWVRDENCDRLPVDERFEFLLCAKQEDRVILSDDNRFSFKFQNIPSDCYEIISCNQDYDVLYSMNGKCESECGEFEIFQGHYQLDVIMIPKKKERFM